MEQIKTIALYVESGIFDVLLAISVAGLTWTVFEDSKVIRWLFLVIVFALFSWLADARIAGVM